MNTIKKTIFLSNKTDVNVKTLATLTLEIKNNLIFGTIKTYNDTPKGDLLLGIKSGNRVIKQNVNFNNSVYNFKLVENINLDDSLGCVLLSQNSNSLTPIIWGSEKVDNSKSQIVSNLKVSLNKLKESAIQKNTSNNAIKLESKQETTQITPQPKTNNTDFYQNLDEYAVSPITSLNHYDAIKLHLDNANEVSQEVAMAQAYSLFESSDSEVNKIIDDELNSPNNNTEHKFYLMLKDQLDELFDKYPREKNLEVLIENSKWVKINTDEKDKHYVVGIISVDNDVKYICYGVPGNYNNEPPMELRGYSQWLPVDTQDPYNNGYWVMYQDSDTGENIYIN